MMPGVRAAPPRRNWAPVAAAWLGGFAVLLLWLRATPELALAEQLKALQFWSLNLCLIAGMGAAVYVCRATGSAPWRRHAGNLAALATVALALVLIAPPRTNRIFYDEQIYQSVGQNLAQLRLAQVCNDGRIEDGRLHCARGAYNKQPYAYPHLLGLSYLVFGVHGWIPFAVNAAIAAATPGFVYLLTVALFEDRGAAFVAGLLIAVLPEQMMWSATAAVEPSASLAAVVSATGAAQYWRRGGLAWMAAAMIATAYAIQFRPESILVIPVVGLLMWDRLRADLEQPRAWWGPVAFLWLSIVPAAHLFAVRHAGWGTNAARFSTTFMAANLRVNGWFYLRDGRFPWEVTLLAACGLWGLRRWRQRWAMCAYFLVFFLVDLAFYAGSYDYGADVRYALMTFPPLAVLGGAGVARVGAALARAIPQVLVHALVAVLVAALVLTYWPVVHQMPEEAWAARADVKFAEATAAQLPRDSYVLTQNPGMFHLWGVSAGQMWVAVAAPAELARVRRQSPGGVYVHWNFWCEVEDPEQPDLCRKAMALGRTELVREYRERDQRFAFYRLRPSE